MNIQEAPIVSHFFDEENESKINVSPSELKKIGGRTIHNISTLTVSAPSGEDFLPLFKQSSGPIGPQAHETSFSNKALGILRKMKNFPCKSEREIGTTAKEVLLTHVFNGKMKQHDLNTPYKRVKSCSFKPKNLAEAIKAMELPKDRDPMLSCEYSKTESSPSLDKKPPRRELSLSEDPSTINESLRAMNPSYKTKS